MGIGDTVIRKFHGGYSMKLKIINIDENFIYCGPWKFDKKTGAEIDEELGWNNKGTGSFIELNKKE
jgi:hypothetical protein